MTIIMEFSEEQIRDILELKERITAQIEKHKEDIEELEKNLRVLDLIVKQTSFTKASLLENSSKLSKADDSIPITVSDGSVIGNAFVTPDQVSIIIKENIDIPVETPPFKSFFLDRIIGGMKKQDYQEAENGRLQKESAIDCIVNKKGSQISEIIIKNYRQRERVNEIINTAGWSLSKMIENTKK